MRETIDILVWLQKWYASQCNGEWEHGYGVHIGTIDNPGWLIKINLQNTFLANTSFDVKKIERNDDDWIQYWVRDSMFHAAGGAMNLYEILNIFKRYVEDGVA